MKKLLLTCCIISLTFGLFGQIPSNGLVAFFPFNGNAKDSSVNKTHGILHNVSLTKDRFGDSNSAYYFSGSASSYMDFDGANLKNNTYSYSLWANLESVNTGALAFALAVGDATGTQGQSLNVAKKYLGSYTGWGAGGYSTVAPNLSVYSDTLPELKKWYHIASIRDSNFVLLYINGKLIDSMGVSSRTYPAYGNSTNGYIGIRDDITAPFKGSIDEVCIYNRVLSKSEILKLYEIKKPTSIEQLPESIAIAFYPNPNLGTIKLNANTIELTHLELYTLDGKLALKQEINNNALIQLPKHISNGTYLVKFYGAKDENIDMQRIIIKREI